MLASDSGSVDVIFTLHCLWCLCWSLVMSQQIQNLLRIILKQSHLLFGHFKSSFWNILTFLYFNFKLWIRDILWYLQILNLSVVFFNQQSSLSGHKNIITFINSAITRMPGSIFEVLILMQYYKGERCSHRSSIMIVIMLNQPVFVTD